LARQRYAYRVAAPSNAPEQITVLVYQEAAPPVELKWSIHDLSNF
jgi:hypothetical protein